jgi:hypothetical protein
MAARVIFTACANRGSIAAPKMMLARGDAAWATISAASLISGSDESEVHPRGSAATHGRRQCHAQTITASRRDLPPPRLLILPQPPLVRLRACRLETANYPGFCPQHCIRSFSTTTVFGSARCSSRASRWPSSSPSLTRFICKILCRIESTSEIRCVRRYWPVWGSSAQSRAWTWRAFVPRRSAGSGDQRMDRHHPRGMPRERR